MMGKPDAAASSVSPGMRVSLKSAASSDGAASEMIDESPADAGNAESGRIDEPCPRRWVCSIGFTGGGGVCSSSGAGSEGSSGLRESPEILSRKLMGSS